MARELLRWLLDERLPLRFALAEVLDRPRSLGPGPGRVLALRGPGAEGPAAGQPVPSGRETSGEPEGSGPERR